MPNKSATGGPVFVVGSPRSGTSILTWCLGQHPNLLPLPESNWMAPFAVDVAVAHLRGSERGDFSQLFSMEMERDPLMKDLGRLINKSIIAHRADYVRHREENPRPGDFPVFEIERSPSEPKKRWVNGTPEYSFGVFGLRKLFPKARFIHLVRNCDKVAASMLNFDKVSGRKLAETEPEAYERWMTYVRAVLAAEEAYGPSIVLRLFHEDLVEQPAKSIGQILKFIEEPFAAECLEPLAFRINSSQVSPDYVAARVSAIHPQVEKARELWETLRSSSPYSTPDPTAAVKLESEFEQKVAYVHNLDAEHANAQRSLKQLDDEFKERSDWAMQLNQEVTQKDRLILSLQDELLDRSQWAASMSQEIAQKDSLIKELQGSCEERTQWALGLQAELDQKAVTILQLEKTFAEQKRRIATLHSDLHKKTEIILEFQKKYENRRNWSLSLRSLMKRLSTPRKARQNH